MNKTMKFLSMAALALVGAVMTGCSNDDIVDIDQPGSNNVERLTVVANLDGSTTRALDTDGKKTYNVGDKIAVVYKNTSGTTVKAESDALEVGDITGSGKSAKFTVALTNPDKNVNVTYIYPAYMAKEDGTVNYDALYNEQDGTLEKLASKFDYCTYTGAWNEEKLPTATLANQLVICEYTLKDNTGLEVLNANVTTMTISDGTNVYIINRTAGAGSIYVVIKPTTLANINYTATTNNGKVWTKSVTEKTYGAGEWCPLGLRMTLDTDMIPGLFSVSASKKVYFAKGNLQLVGENSWKFADKQWDCFGDTQANNNRDLFGWGTGDNPNQTSEDNDNYATFTDWGNNSFLQAQLGTGWRTLSNDEWHYLFKTRTVKDGKGAGHSYTLGQSVNGRLGAVIYPDGYTGTLYTGSDWNTFEAAGCVFLPAAGARWGNTVGYFGESGYYWSSTPKEDNSAYSVNITSDQLYTNNAPFYRNNGQSVRLVRDIVAP